MYKPHQEVVCHVLGVDLPHLQHQGKVQSRMELGLLPTGQQECRDHSSDIAPTTKPATFAPINPFSTRSGSSSAPRMGLPKRWTCRDIPSLKYGAYAGAHDAPDMPPQCTIPPQSAALDVQRSAYSLGAVLPLAKVVAPALPLQMGTLLAKPPLQVISAMPVLTQCAAAGYPSL